MKMMIGITMMIKVILILFTILTISSFYGTYMGIGLEEVVSEEPKHHLRSSSSRSYSSGGWSYGK